MARLLVDEGQQDQAQVARPEEAAAAAPATAAKPAAAETAAATVATAPFVAFATVAAFGSVMAARSASAGHRSLKPAAVGSRKSFSKHMKPQIIKSNGGNDISFICICQ
jgi:hypothetical protein